MATVLLFNPPGPDNRPFTREGRCTQEAGVWATLWPPVTLATAAAVLQQDGHTVHLFDFPAIGRTAADLKQVLRRHAYDLVAWSTGTPTLQWDLSLAPVIRTLAPTALTAVFGTHVSALAETVLRSSRVDMVIRREPEPGLAAVCNRIDDGWQDAPGISWRDRSGGDIRHNPDAPFLNPAGIPAPAWDLLDLSPYRLPLKGRPFVIVAPVRGCPFPCSFCTARVYYGRKLRKRPVGTVVDEIEANIRRHGIRDFFIWADTFTADREYVEAFCRSLMDRRLGPVAWTCNSRVDTVDAELLELMKAAGMWMISFGIESGDDGILKKSGKHIRVAQSRRAVRIAHEAGIRVSGHFIFGLPGETRTTMEKTLALALELPLDIAQFYSAAPFPGTPLYREAVDNQWVSAAGSYGQHSAVMDLPGLPAAEVDEFRRRAFRRFYLRPRAVMRLAAMTEPEAIRQMIGNLRGFLGWIRK